MWTYEQSTGRLANGAAFVGSGYSGIGQGLNNPLMQNVPDIGPIPQGLYAIGEPFDSLTHGPFVMTLTPDATTEVFGRSGFLMHGDSIENAGLHLASHGCLIAARRVRNLVASSGDKELTVIA